MNIPEWNLQSPDLNMVQNTVMELYIEKYRSIIAALRKSIIIDTETAHVMSFHPYPKITHSNYFFNHIHYNYIV